MGIALSPADVTADSLQPLGASLTAFEITKVGGCGMTTLGSLNVRFDIEVSAATGTVTAKLQSRSPNGAYADLVGANASVVISGAGTFSLRQNVEVTADQPNMPLQKQVRVVVTTAAASSVTISKVWLEQGK